MLGRSAAGGLGARASCPLRVDPDGWLPRVTGRMPAFPITPVPPGDGTDENSGWRPELK